MRGETGLHRASSPGGSGCPSRLHPNGAPLGPDPDPIVARCETIALELVLPSPTYTCTSLCIPLNNPRTLGYWKCTIHPSTIHPRTDLASTLACKAYFAGSRYVLSKDGTAGERVRWQLEGY